MFTLPELPYAYDALKDVIDEETMHLHHDKHHATYVTNLNDALSAYPDLSSSTIEDLLMHLDTIPEDIRTKVRNNGGGHYNHTLYWNSMIPGGANEPSGKLLSAINTTYGNVVAFKEQVTAKALSRFGSGWVWVIKDGIDKLNIVDSPNQDNPLMEGIVPILGLDVWEHAYYLKYQNRRAEYVAAWWTVVNWSEVQQRYESI